MDELIAEFKALVDQLPNEGGLATSIGLLLQQMEARSAIVSVIDIQTLH